MPCSECIERPECYTPCEKLEIALPRLKVERVLDIDAIEKHTRIVGAWPHAHEAMLFAVAVMPPSQVEILKLIVFRCLRSKAIFESSRNMAFRLDIYFFKGIFSTLSA